ncbi:uncharacterized protein [Henckelia pumila]|uniref:uncharacterized protein n=1 Tax=Henckelia pumila TaxID=405737 RepID=UPI003C6E5622
MARVRRVLFWLCSILLSFPVLIPAAVVTLDSIEIFTTHEWLLMKPTVYFRCSGENRTVLPDVKEKHVVYTFKGVESWQPLTELPDIKCKRCGFYEKDAISDDTFDEWEFCASDFSMPDGKYTHFKDKELNATFICPECSPHANVTVGTSRSKEDSSGMHWAVIAAIIAVASSVSIAVMVATYKYWQKRKRQHEQARFLKLFEETDDIEDELGIGPLSHVI